MERKIKPLTSSELDVGEKRLAGPGDSTSWLEGINNLWNAVDCGVISSDEARELSLRQMRRLGVFNPQLAEQS